MSIAAVLPSASSKFWPRLIFGIALLAAIAVVVKTRAEILRTRDHASGELERRIRDRARADKLEAAWNPGHLVPMTEDVFGGVPDELVRVAPVDPDLQRPSMASDESTKVEIQWTSPQQVHALLDRSFEGPRADTAFVDNVIADFLAMTKAVPLQEPR